MTATTASSRSQSCFKKALVLMLLATMAMMLPAEAAPVRLRAGEARTAGSAGGAVEASEMVGEDTSSASSSSSSRHLKFNLQMCKRRCVTTRTNKIASCRKKRRCRRKKNSKNRKLCNNNCAKLANTQRTNCLKACNRKNNKQGGNKNSNCPPGPDRCPRIRQPLKCNRGGPPPKAVGVTPGKTEWFVNKCKAEHCSNDYDVAKECYVCPPFDRSTRVKCQVNDPDELDIYDNQCLAEFSGYYSDKCVPYTG